MHVIRYVNKKVVIIAGLSATILLSNPVSPAPARANVLDDVLAEFSELSEIYRQVYDQLSSSIQQFTDSVEQLGEDFDVVFSEALGAMGLADPIALQTQLEQELRQIPQLEAGEEVMAMNDLSRQLNRLQTRAASQAVLSEAGQQRTSQKLAFNEATVSATQQQVSAVITAPSTHEAIKAMAKMTAGGASLQAALHAEMVQSQQSQALVQQNIADIESLMSAEARSAYLERMGGALYLLKYSPSLTTLP